MIECAQVQKQQEKTVFAILPAWLRFPTSDGIVPVKSFVETWRYHRFDSCPTLGLIVPVRRFLLMEKLSNCERL
jgi:hypothetical protein